jgi:hypothetical protein
MTSTTDPVIKQLGAHTVRLDPEDGRFWTALKGREVKRATLRDLERLLEQSADTPIPVLAVGHSYWAVYNCRPAKVTRRLQSNTYRAEGLRWRDPEGEHLGKNVDHVLYATPELIAAFTDIEARYRALKIEQEKLVREAVRVHTDAQGLPLPLEEVMRREAGNGAS